MKYAFTHANLLDGSRDMAVQQNMTVLTDGEAIVSIEEGGAAPSSYTEIDLSAAG